MIEEGSCHHLQFQDEVLKDYQVLKAMQGKWITSTHMESTQERKQGKPHTGENVFKPTYKFQG